MAQQVMWEAETERDFQAKVVKLAKTFGWHIVHFRPARTLKGWRTPLQGDAGFPDTVLVHESDDGSTAMLIFWELKSEKGKVTEEEAVWLANLAKVPGIISGVKRPHDWETIVEILGG